MDVVTSLPDVIVRFLGAARGIGGSMLAVESGRHRILLDCGRPIGGRRSASVAFPVEPESVDIVALSHAHQDHAGWLSDFCAAGFDGPVVSTSATRDLVEVQLTETLSRRRENTRIDAIVRGKQNARGSWRTDVILDRFTCPEDESAIVSDVGARISLRRAGHLLGAAGVLLEWHGRSVYFTGDLGRQDSPLYFEPATVPLADLIVSESTYGDRKVEPFATSTARLGAIIATAIADNGRVIIPAFSLGRIQLLLFAIHTLRQQGSIPSVPIVVDSPTARAFADAHMRNAGELRPFDMKQAWFNDHISYAESEDDSRNAVESFGPAIVLVSGGMADSYRAKRQLKAHIDDPRCRIILVSFQAPDTLGYRLLEPGPSVRIDGRNYNKWAEVSQLGGFSGHADRDELMNLLVPVGRTGRAIRLVHGEPPSANALAEALRDAGCTDVAVPRLADEHRLRSPEPVG